MLKESINQILMLPKHKVLKIGKHVKEQTNGNNSDISFKKEHQKIHRNHGIGVEKMKTNTHPVRIKNRIGKQMIQIDEHG